LSLVSNLETSSRLSTKSCLSDMVTSRNKLVFVCDGTVTYISNYIQEISLRFKLMRIFMF